MLSLCTLVLLITGATFTAGNQTRALTAALTRQHQQVLASIRVSVSVVVVLGGFVVVLGLVVVVVVVPVCLSTKTSASYTFIVESPRRHCVVSLSKTHLSWLSTGSSRKTRPDITEQLLAGTKGIKPNKKKTKKKTTTQVHCAYQKIYFPLVSNGPVHFHFKACWVVFFIAITVNFYQRRL